MWRCNSKNCITVPENSVHYCPISTTIWSMCLSNSNSQNISIENAKRIMNNDVWQITNRKNFSEFHWRIFSLFQHSNRQRVLFFKRNSYTYTVENQIFVQVLTPDHLSANIQYFRTFCTTFQHNLFIIIFVKTLTFFNITYNIQIIMYSWCTNIILLSDKYR